MQTRREYLVGLGLAKDGRGKLSNAAHEAIAKAVASGMEFSDLQGPVVVKSDNTKTTKVVKQASEDSVNNYSEGFMRYPQSQMFVGQDENGKTHKVNVRQGCYHGKGSIMGCQHTGETHRVLVGYAQWIDVTPIGE